MEGIHGSVGAVSLGLRREAIDKESGEQATQGCNERNQPESMRADELVIRADLRAGRLISGNPGQQQAIADAQHPHKQLGTERASHTQQRRFQHEPRFAVAQDGAVLSIRLHRFCRRGAPTAGTSRDPGLDDDSALADQESSALSRAGRCDWALQEPEKEIAASASRPALPASRTGYRRP